MLFYYPAEIKLRELPAVLSRWLQVLQASPLDGVSLMQISVVGWKGNDRYELRGTGGFGSYIIFDRCVDVEGQPIAEWSPRLSDSLSDSKAEDEEREQAGWFEHTPRRR